MLHPHLKTFGRGSITNRIDNNLVDSIRIKEEKLIFLFLPLFLIFTQLKGFDFFKYLVLGEQNIRISKYSLLIWNLIFP